MEQRKRRVLLRRRRRMAWQARQGSVASVAGGSLHCPGELEEIFSRDGTCLAARQGGSHRSFCPPLPPSSPSRSPRTQSTSSLAGHRSIQGSFFLFFLPPGRGFLQNTWGLSSKYSRRPKQPSRLHAYLTLRQATKIEPACPLSHSSWTRDAHMRHTQRARCQRGDASPTKTPFAGRRPPPSLSPQSAGRRHAISSVSTCLQLATPDRCMHPAQRHSAVHPPSCRVTRIHLPVRSSSGRLVSSPPPRRAG